MKMLVACEFSGIVREAFKRHGWDAWSCDLLDTEIPGQHIIGDVREYLDEFWDLLIFHAPCTYLTNSGVRWLYNKNHTLNQERWVEMLKAAEFFKMLLNANVPLIAGENPIPHKYAAEAIGCSYTQIIQPWWFGHGEIKATCLWLKNLPPLVKTNEVEGRTPRVHYEPPGPNRWKNRSRTLPGVAEAMADQWTRCYRQGILSVTNHKKGE